jgi:hypothetical protein
MTAITLPVKIDFKTWAQQIIEDLPNIEMPFPGEEEDWEDWVSKIILNNPGIDVPIAKYLTYKTSEHWREWAEHFVVIVQSS